MTINKFPIKIKNKDNKFEMTAVVLQTLSYTKDTESFHIILNQYPPLTVDWLLNQLEIMDTKDVLNVSKFLTNTHYIILNKLYALNLVV